MPGHYLLRRLRQADGGQLPRRRPRPAYECTPAARDSRPPVCRRHRRGRLDDAVAGVLLDALTPGRSRSRSPAAEEVTGQHQRASRAAELAVERARHDADRAERAFSPSSRKTGWSPVPWRPAGKPGSPRSPKPSRRWRPPGHAAAAAQPGHLEKLAADLPALWNAPTTSASDRKRLLRTLIADVTLLPEPDQAKARIGIRWHTGATDDTHHRPAPPPRVPAATPVPGRRDGPQPRPDRRHRDLAGHLDPAGYRTGARQPFDVQPSSGSATSTRSPHPSPSPPASSALPRPPGSSAAAPASSTTGSRPGNSMPAAAPGTGSASPGPTAPRPAAAPAWPHPGTSTPKPGAPGPGKRPHGDRNVSAVCHAQSTDPRMRA